MRKNVAAMYRFLLTSTLASGLIFVFADAVNAFPGRGANCAECHSPSAEGNVDVSPDPLSLIRGSSDELTLDVTAVPEGANAIFSLTGLDDPALAASILSAGWTLRADGQYTLSGITSTGPTVLEIGTDASSVPADYPVQVFLAGGSNTGLWSTSADFTLQSLVPEPGSIALASILGGAFAVGWMTRRRRKKA